MIRGKIKNWTLLFLEIFSWEKRRVPVKVKVLADKKRAFPTWGKLQTKNPRFSRDG
jgi:hypothetical protein